MKYVFYDTETTGLNAAFDQMLQFAAIEVDEDLNEVSSINIRCRILPYILPSPGALVVTRVSPDMLTSSNHSYLEMVQQIREWIGARSPAMIIGHNSIKFDESFLRQAFYQTLHPVYLTNTNGNCRGDTMRMAQAASIFAPSKISVPLSDKGKPTFRLGPLTRANNIEFDEDDAHDALADVKATVELARLLRRDVPDIWEQMALNATKKTALEFMKRNNVFCAAESNFGNHSCHLVSAISASDDGRMAVFDMAHAPAAYFEASVNEIIELMKGPNRIIRTIAANKQPMIFDTNIGYTLLDTAQFPKDVLVKHVQEIRAATEFRSRVAEALAQYYEDQEPSEHIEEHIYKGFPSRNDAQLMEQFHRSPHPQKLAICEKFEDPRFGEFGLRLIYADNPDHLPKSHREKLEARLYARHHEQDKTPWMTYSKAAGELADLRAKGENLALVDEIERYMSTRRTAYTASA